MKKRMMSLLLTAAMIMSMIVVPATAADPIKFTVDTVSGTPGSEVTVNVTASGLAEDFTGYSGGTVIVSFDSEVLEVVKQGSKLASVGPAWSGTMMLTSQKDLANKDDPNVVKCIYMDTTAVEMPEVGTMASNGVIATLKFRIKDTIDASVTETPVKLSTVFGFTALDMTTNLNDTITPVDGEVSVTWPVTVTTTEPVQSSATEATVEVKTDILAGSGVTVDKTGIYWGTTEALGNTDNTAPFTMTTATVGGKLFYQGYAIGSDGITYKSAIKEYIFEAPKADKVVITGDTTSIKVAKDGSEATYGATVYDQFDSAFPADVAWSVKTEQPSAITIDQSGKVSVTKDAQSEEITITAKIDEDTFADKQVSIVRDPAQVASITISTTDEANVPTKAEYEANGAATVQMIASGEDQYGTISEVDATWSITTPNVEGVKIDSATGVVSIDNTADKGEIKIKAVYAEGVDATYTLSIDKAASDVTKVVFENADSTMAIPTGDENTVKTFTPTVYDQFGTPMLEAVDDVEYAFNGDANVTADKNTITVTKYADPADYTLTATCSGKSADLTVKVVDIVVPWDSVTFNESSSPVYGMTWNQIITNIRGNNAEVPGIGTVTGTYSVVDGDKMPNAGETEFKIQFVGDGYTVDQPYTLKKAVDKKTITATWSDVRGLVYTGNPVNVTATAEVELVVTGGDAKDAGTDYKATAVVAGENAKNYELKNPTLEYKIAKATPTLANIPGQQLRYDKTRDDLLDLLNNAGITATGVKSEALSGEFSTQYVFNNPTIGRTIPVAVTFTPDDANYTAINTTVNVEITEGDPQKIEIVAIGEKVYGDAAFALSYNVVEGNKTGKVTYSVVSGDNVVSIDENGEVTILNAGTATLKVTVEKDDVYAEGFAEVSLTVAPKTVTVSGITAADKAYDGKTDAVLDLTAAVINGKVGEDELTVTDAKGAFDTAAAGADKTVAITDIVLDGAAKANYVLSDAAVTTTATISKADAVVTLGNLNQSPDRVTAVTATAAPASEGLVINVEYEYIKTPAVAEVVGVDCDHVGEAVCENLDEAGACKHGDCGCAYVKAVEAKPAEMDWTTDLTKIQAAGTYDVRAWTEGDANINATPKDGDNWIYITGKLTVQASSGGGSSTPTYSASVEKVDNGSVTLSNKYAPAGKEVTLNIKPDAGFELKDIVVTDAKGNEIEVTLKDGKYTFVMPKSKVTVSPEFVAVAEECPSEDFSDLDTNAWYHEAVDFAIKNGIMAGVSEGKFAPGMDLTRSMVVQILWAMDNKPVVNYAMNFADVPSDAWFTEAVRWAASEGIVSGYSAEQFGANDAVTREQMAVMLYGYARYKDADLSAGENTNILSYADASAISEWAFTGLQWACGEGILSGKTGGYLDPTGTATRMEAAQMLMKFSAALAD